MNFAKLIASFNKLPWLLRALLSLCFAVMLVLLVLHHELIESITRFLQAIPLIIVFRAGSPSQQDQSETPSSPPLQTQQSRKNATEP